MSILGFKDIFEKERRRQERIGKFAWETVDNDLAIIVNREDYKTEAHAVNAAAALSCGNHNVSVLVREGGKDIYALMNSELLNLRALERVMTPKEIAI